MIGERGGGFVRGKVFIKRKGHECHFLKSVGEKGGVTTRGIEESLQFSLY